MSINSPQEIKSAIWFSAEAGELGVLARYAEHTPDPITPNNYGFANDIDYAKVKSLVDSRDPNDQGNTALHKAVLHRNRNAIQLLLNIGASINAKNYAGQTPFELSFEYGNNDLITANIKDSKNTAAKQNKHQDSTALALTLIFVTALCIAVPLILIEFSLIEFAIALLVISPFIFMGTCLLRHKSDTQTKSPVTFTRSDYSTHSNYSMHHVSTPLQSITPTSTVHTPTHLTSVAPAFTTQNDVHLNAPVYVTHQSHVHYHSAPVPVSVSEPRSSCVAAVVANTSALQNDNSMVDLQKAARNTAVSMHNMAEDVREHQQLRVTPVMTNTVTLPEENSFADLQKAVHNSAVKMHNMAEGMREHQLLAEPA